MHEKNIKFYEVCIGVEFNVYIRNSISIFNKIKPHFAVKTTKILNFLKKLK